MEIKTKESSTGKIFLGIILILIGLILLEDTFGIDIGEQIFPILLIGFGVYLMIRKRNKERKISFNHHADDFQQKANDFESKVNEKFHQTNSSFDQNINKFDQKVEKFEKKIDNLGKSFDENLKKVENKYFPKEHDYTEASHKNGKIKYEKPFGDLFINCKGVNAQNIEVSSFFGEINIQMQEAIFAEGLNRLIISNFIGDVNLYIPKDIPIFSNCSNFIGDIESLGKRSTGFGNKVESHSTEYDSTNRKLYIACNSFIGDIHIITV